jgi:hypothetical protein
MSAITSAPPTTPHPSPLHSVSSPQNSVSSVLKTSASASSALKTPSASSLPPAEPAWALCCQGLRSPAIAPELCIPERTIRSWLDRARKELLEERQATRAELLALALERHLAIAAARMAAIGARSLSVALAAQREIARLQGLHIIVPPPPPPVDFVIAYCPEGPLDLEALAAEEAAERAALEQAAQAEAEASDDPDNADNADSSGDLLQHDTFPTPAPSVSSV